MVDTLENWEGATPEKRFTESRVDEKASMDSYYGPLPILNT